MMNVSGIAKIIGQASRKPLPQKLSAKGFPTQVKPTFGGNAPLKNNLPRSLVSSHKMAPAIGITKVPFLTQIQQANYATAKKKKKSWSTAAMREFFGSNAHQTMADLATKPPVATKIPYVFSKHGINLRDDYFYMNRLATDPASQRYMVDEDTYCRMRIQQELSQYATTLKKELLSQVIHTPQTVPERVGEYLYYARNDASMQMSTYCRRKGDGPEEVILDGNKELQKYEQLSILSIKVSQDHSKLLALFDTTGQETCDVIVTDLTTGERLPLEVTNVCNAEWAMDGKSFFYTSPDPKKRASAVYHHIIGTSRDQDRLVFEEKDDQFFVDVSRTKDWKYLVINSNSKTTSELRLLEAANPHLEPDLIMARTTGSEFYMEHSSNGAFYIVTAENKDANYKIMRCADGDIKNMSKWQEIVPATPKVRIDDVDVFTNNIVLYERHEGLIHIRVLDTNTLESKYIPLPSNICHVEPGTNLDPNSKTFRFTYSTPIVPGITYDYNFETNELKEVEKLVIPKAEGARKAFTPEDYEVRRVMVDSTGGAKVPLTLVHRKGMEPSGDNLSLIHVYGAYGHTMNVGFDAEMLPLLARGWVIAYAHVRGGGDLGLKWYQAGKLMNKRNTFDDFVNCSQYLIDSGITRPEWLVAKAASAGGLVLAQAANDQPGLFKAMIMRSPFLDLVNTMTNDSLPLTVHEYDEWGNPNEKDVFEYMVSYDPYHNIKSQDYPAMYITSSLIDIRTPPWNHSRYVAKLRAHKTDSNMVFLRLDTQFGHFGDGSSAGRAAECADELSFLHSALNIVPDRI